MSEPVPCTMCDDPLRRCPLCQRCFLCQHDQYVLYWWRCRTGPYAGKDFRLMLPDAQGHQRVVMVE